jgi:sepiapterin reductase
MSQNSHLIIVTGACRGFGLSIVMSFAKRIRTPLHFVLVTRSEENMSKTIDAINVARIGRTTHVDTVFADLTKTEELEEVAGRVFNYDPAQFAYVTFISNAGCLGRISPVGDCIDLPAYLRASTLHTTVSYVFVSELLRRFKNNQTKINIINLTSLWALTPVRSFSIYCSTKAANEMFYNVVASENNPEFVRVLNYAPGPLDTDMQQELRNIEVGIDPEIKANFLAMKSEGTLIHPDISADKCARLVIEELFVSGAHVDYFDEVEGIEFPRTVPPMCCKCPTCQCGPTCNCKAVGVPHCDPCAVFMGSR